MAKLAGLKSQVRRLREMVARSLPVGKTQILDQLRADPVLPFTAMGWKPDPWQEAFLRSPAKRESLLCSRRAGKTCATAAKVVREALVHDGADVLVFSPTMRQSMEVLRTVRKFWDALGRPLAAKSDQKTCLEFANDSRVMSLPDNQEGVVGVGNPRLIVIDEAARVSDELYLSVRPMLAETDGALVNLSTPFGNEGWFFGIWDESGEGLRRRAKLNEQWRRTAITAEHCPRIKPAFLEDERVELGDRWFMQEYYLKFLDSIDAVFAQSVIHGARSEGIEPLFDLGA